MKLWNMTWVFNGTFMNRSGCTWKEIEYISNSVRTQGGTVTGVAMCS